MEVHKNMHRLQVFHEGTTLGGIFTITSHNRYW